MHLISTTPAPPAVVPTRLQTFAVAFSIIDFLISSSQRSCFANSQSTLLANEQSILKGEPSVKRVAALYRISTSAGMSYLAFGLSLSKCALRHKNIPNTNLQTATCPPRPVSLEGEDIILEGDLVAYRQPPAPKWTVAAVISQTEADNFTVRPVVQRDGTAEKDVLELFVNWTSTAEETAIQKPTHEIRLLDADFEERVVQDRIENPHGEMSEYCWRISREALGTDILPVVQGEE